MSRTATIKVTALVAVMLCIIGVLLAGGLLATHAAGVTGPHSNQSTSQTHSVTLNGKSQQVQGKNTQMQGKSHQGKGHSGSSHGSVKGHFTEFSIPTLNSGASYITKGPDGAFWFTEFTTN